MAVTYDPMVPEYSRRPDGRFDLVTCFETLEHLPDPQAGITQIVEFVADPGLILFTTLLLPADFDTQRLNRWYIGPCNGHVSIFSRQALTGVWSRFGYKQYPSRISHPAALPCPSAKMNESRRCSVRK